MQVIGGLALGLILAFGSEMGDIPSRPTFGIFSWLSLSIFLPRLLREIGRGCHLLFVQERLSTS